MRRWLIAALAALSAGCASAAPPPGGAEDHAPPKLVRVTPDTNAVNVTDKVVTFYFDETINDRGSGATEVGNYFLVSPSDGNARVSWHRSRIEVRPRLGFRPNTAYTVTLLPGLTDLRNNAMRTGASVIFSTGPTIPTIRLTGTVFDWASERPAARALVQGVTPDSIMYLAQSDSLGHFTLGPLPAGSYVVRGVIDANGNHALDRNEAFDTVRVVAPHAEPLELLAIVRDTLPPRILSVTQADSVSLRVTFDRPLDQGAIPPVAAFRLVGPDSAEIRITAVLTPLQETEAAKVASDARADSARRADSLAGKPPVRAPAPAPTPAPAARRGPPSRNATVSPEGPKPSLPAPPSSLLLRIAHPLAPAAIHRLSVTDARALSGRVGSSDRAFTTPRPPPPRAATDSARRPPVTPRTAPAAPPGAPATSTPPVSRPAVPPQRR